MFTYKLNACTFVTCSLNVIVKAQGSLEYACSTSRLHVMQDNETW